jgi:peptidoglycan/xylan/chitin deacetylase (PgdA/CDA1 family)
MPRNAGEDTLAVLAFHSISLEPGPTSIAPATFRMQMELLAESGFTSMTCQDFLDWHEGRLAAPRSRVLITFDDGYADFATEAYPVLRAHGYSAIVFVPTGKLGQREDWRGANAAPRPLMDWATVADLAHSGIEFGGHGVTHTDLTLIAAERRREEIEASARQLAERLGHRTRSFAAPYGRVTPEVIREIGETYDVAFGTRFDRARRTSDRFDMPRIEMHYFRNPRRWRAFLAGEREYFLARRALRSVKSAGMRILRRGDAA